MKWHLSVSVSASASLRTSRASSSLKKRLITSSFSHVSGRSVRMLWRVTGMHWNSTSFSDGFPRWLSFSSTSASSASVSARCPRGTTTGCAAPPDAAARAKGAVPPGAAGLRAVRRPAVSMRTRLSGPTRSTTKSLLTSQPLAVCSASNHSSGSPSIVCSIVCSELAHHSSPRAHAFKDTRSPYES